MFDAHRHFNADNSSLANAIYATAEPKEWQRAIAASNDAPCALGALADNPLPQAETLYNTLTTHPALQIGEVGLDRRFGSLKNQERFLHEALHIASELDRLIILHVVQADGRAIEILRSFDTPLPRVLWHGCTASFESRKILADLGVIVSYGPTLFGSKSAREPSNLFVGPWVLESDWEGEDEGAYQSFYSEHIRAFAVLTGLTIESVIRNNDEIRAVLTDQPPPRQ